MQLVWIATEEVVGLNSSNEIEVYPKSTIGEKTEWIYDDGVFVSKVNSELALDIPGCSMIDGVNIIAYQKHGRTNQKWFSENGQLHSCADRKFVLAIADGKLVLQRNIGRQKWAGFETENERETKPIQLKWYGTGDLIGINDDDEVCLFNESEAGPRTEWLYEEGTFVSNLDRNLALDIPACNISDGVKIIAYQRHGGMNQLWRCKDGLILCECDHSYVLSIKDGFLVLESTKEDGGNDMQKWFEFPVSADQLPNEEHHPRPATSCHLTFGPLPAEKLSCCKSWKIENTVRPLKTEDTTYFCVIGWGPAGYSGIQQGCGKRNFIFSMWNNDEYNVSEVSRGDGVIVSEFGGEGTGLKSMKDVEWTDDTDIKFTVTGTYQDDKSWICDCNVLVGDVNHFMARYKRYGPHPFTYFYSFVEDWDRSWKSCGHTLCREAEFHSPSVEIDGERFELTEARFTKVEDGSDRFAADKAHGGSRDGRFFLASGGEKSFSCENGCCFSVK